MTNTTRTLRAAALLTAVLPAAACGPEARPDADPDDVFAAEMVRLKGEVLHESEILGQPLEVARVGDRLVVLDGFANPAVHVLRASDGAHERSFGRKGGGPREFQAPASLDPVPGSHDEIWIFDARLLRFTHVDLGRDSAAAVGRTVVFRGPHLPLAPVWLDGGRAVAPGLFPTGRLGEFDSTGTFVRTVGEFPAEDDAPPHVVQHAYTGPLVAKPDRSRVALLTRHADQVEIYRADGRTVRVARGPMGFAPAYRVRTVQGTPAMAQGEDLRFGYIGATATDRHLFGLFSGRTRADRPGLAHYGAFVHAFDWEGNRRATFKLDAYIIGIGVAPDERTLYAVRAVPTPAILRYALPEIL